MNQLRDFDARLTARRPTLFTSRPCMSLIEPILRSEAARLIPLLRCHPPLGDAKCPNMTFSVPAAISAVAVELSRGFLQDFRSRSTCALTMGINVLAFRKLDVDRLRVFAPD